MRHFSVTLVFMVLGASLLCQGCDVAPSRLAQQSDRYYQKAIRSYKQKIQAGPDAVSPKLELAALFMQHKAYDEVLSLLSQVPDPRAREYVAVASYYQGDSTAALDIFERLRKENHLEQPSSLLVFGKVLEEKNLYEQALKVYGEISENPFAADAASRMQAIKLTIETAAVDAETARLIEQGRKTVYPNNPAAVILKAEEKTVVTEDNREVTSIHFLVLVKEERAKEDFGEIHIGYDSTYEKVKLLFARTISEEGRVLAVGKKNIRDVSKYLNYPLYSNARVLIISMPELKVGAVVEYAAEISSSKLVADTHFSYRYTLQEKYPIHEALYSVDVPSDRPFRYTIVNQRYTPRNVQMRPQMDTHDTYTRYSWRFSNIPELKEEPSRSVSADINPTILISSFTDWKQISSWWYSLYKDKLELTPEMKSFVRDLLKDKKTAYDQAEALYEFCATQIRYVGVEYGEAGFTPHKASDIYVNRYGDCKDQAILLVALLREAGLSAYPVLIPTKGRTQMQEDFPALLYNHAIAAVELDKKIICMDSTSEVVQFEELPRGDQDRVVLVFKDGAYQILRTILSTKNLLRYDIDVRFSAADDAVIERTVSASGYFAARHRAYFRYTEPYVVVQNIQEKTKKINPFAELLDYKIEYHPGLSFDPVLQYRFKAPHPLLRAGKLRIVPLLNEIDFEEEWIAPEKREYPLDLSMLQTVQVKTNIHYGKYFSLYYIPTSFRITNPWFDFSVDYQKTADTIYYTEDFRLKKDIISPTEYSSFKKQMETALLKVRDQIILEEQKP